MQARRRPTNDNALAECNNDAVVRKPMGDRHIPHKHATAINTFYRDILSPYVNFHWHCYLAVDTFDHKSR